MRRVLARRSGNSPVISKQLIFLKLEVHRLRPSLGSMSLPAPAFATLLPASPEQWDAIYASFSAAFLKGCAPAAGAEQQKLHFWIRAVEAEAARLLAERGRLATTLGDLVDAFKRPDGVRPLPKNILVVLTHMAKTASPSPAQVGENRREAERENEPPLPAAVAVPETMVHTPHTRTYTNHM